MNYKNFIPPELVQTSLGIIVAGSVDSGKCFIENTKIMMYDGTIKNVQDIKVNDLVMGDDSTCRKVLGLHSGYGKLYDIYTDENKYTVNKHHILCLKYLDTYHINYNSKLKCYYLIYIIKDNNIPKIKIKSFKVSINQTKKQVHNKIINYIENINKVNYGDIIEISVEEYLKLPKIIQNKLEWYRVMVEYKEQKVKMCPYDYGLYIRDNIRLCIKNDIKILDIYKYNSKINRMKLLYGIFGTDNFNKINSINIPLKYENLKNDLIFVIKSLGFTFYDNYNDYNNNYYNIKFSQSILPHIYTSKIRIKAKSNYDKYYGFEIDNNHRFLLDDFSVSHNSTLIGVLYSGKLDDGSGAMRNLVARHPHEIKTGKTSDVSVKMLYSGNSKAITLIDLCGHEKYLKTTTSGITGQYPDYAIVVIAANRGILKMTKEHLGILFYMRIPVIIVISRVDIAPPDIYNNTIKNIKAMCKYYNKTPEFINGIPNNLNSNNDNLNNNDNLINNDNINLNLEQIKNLSNVMNNTCDYIPVISVSNKTGYYINVLKELINELQPRKLWDISKIDYNYSIFYIDGVFSPPGVEIVVSGIVKGKKLSVGDIIFIGPIGHNFIQVRIRSMHNNFKQSVTELNDHERGCIAISTIGKQVITKKMIIRGMIIISSKYLIKNLCYKFKAEIEILHHSVTINKGYSPVLHLGNVRQSASIIDVEEICGNNSNNLNNTIRTGNKAVVIFKFKFKPEFIENGIIFFFREGTTRGVGKIIHIYPINEDKNAFPDPIERKNKKNKRLSVLQN